VIEIRGSCIGGGRNYVSNIINPRRAMMRSLLIKVIVGMLCFMFVGVSWVWAGETKEYKTKSEKILKVYFDDNQKIIKGEFEGETVWPKNVNTLSFKVKSDKQEYELKSLTPGTVIYTGPGDTCVWVFDGYTCVYKCF
jgi:hypothetical protein